MARRLLLILLAMSLCSCGKTILVDGVKVSRKYWQKESVQLASRSSYELKCDDVTLRLLRSDPGLYRFPIEVGADGCGKRVVYVWIDEKWILSTANVATPVKD